MPSYKLGERVYDIPDNKIDAFENQFPYALLSYNANGNVYEIPASKRRDFLGSFPDASETGWKNEAHSVY